MLPLGYGHRQVGWRVPAEALQPRRVRANIKKVAAEIIASVCVLEFPCRAGIGTGSLEPMVKERINAVKRSAVSTG